MLILIFILSVAAILGIFYMFKVPFIPVKHGPWDTVLFNLVIAVVLAAMFDRGIWKVALIILCGKLLVDKLRTSDTLKKYFSKKDKEQKKEENGNTGQVS